MLSKNLLLISLIVAILSLTIILIEVIKRPSILWRWDWEILFFELTNGIVNHGDTVGMDIIIQNKGRRLRGTVYIVIKIYPLYDKETVIFNSHKNLSKAEKLKLKALDLMRGEKRRIHYDWIVPKDLKEGEYKVIVELWSPHLLHNGPKKYRFHYTKWKEGKDFHVFKKVIRSKKSFSPSTK